MPIAEIFSAAVLLLLVIDPFGNVPIVVSALANVAPARRARVVLRECVAAYVILLAFMFGGQTFLQWLQLSRSVARDRRRHHPVPDRAADGVPPSRRRCSAIRRAPSRSSCRSRYRRSPDRPRSRR